MALPQPISSSADEALPDAAPAPNLALVQRGKPKASWVLMRRLFRGYLLRHISAVSLLPSVFMTVAAAMTGLFARQLEPIVDGIFQHRGMAYHFAISCLIVVAIFVVRGVTTYLHTVIMNKHRPAHRHRRAAGNVRHLLRADLAFFHANASGALSRASSTMSGVMRQAVGECLTTRLRAA
jgi:subfamily B ATP-binding cassette protein MsbA